MAASDSGNDVFTCPTCGRGFDTKKGRSVHHTSAHGESIAKQTKICVVCGDEFETYNDSQRACSETCKGSVISEVKDKGETENCEFCGSTVDIEPWEREWKDMFFCDMGCKSSWQEERSPKEHPSWKGGYNRRGPNWEAVRKEVLERDGGICAVCGKTGEDTSGGSLHVHHITPLVEFDSPEEANSRDNLITLCPEHHVKVENGHIECPKPEVDYE